MKKQTLLLAAAMCCATLMNAQDKKSVRFGLKVAPNLGWVSPKDKATKSDGSVLGFDFGLMSDFMIGANQNYAFSTGLFYMTKLGGKYEYTDDISSTKGELKLQYVHLPITMKLKTNEIGYMTYYGQIGGDFGLNTGAKANVSTTIGGVTVGEDDVDFSKSASSFRAALIVGAGLEYNFSGNTSAMVGVTYSNGFTNVFDSDYGGEAKLHYLELSLGFFF